MKPATVQHYSSGKWLHCRHGVFQTRFNDFNVDLKLINSFFAANEMQISRNLSENVNYKRFGVMIFWSISMHLDSTTKVKTNVENDDEMYAMTL